MRFREVTLLDQAEAQHARAAGAAAQAIPGRVLAAVGEPLNPAAVLAVSAAALTAAAADSPSSPAPDPSRPVATGSPSLDDDDRVDGRYLEVHQSILSLLRETPITGSRMPRPQATSQVRSMKSVLRP